VAVLNAGRATFPISAKVTLLRLFGFPIKVDAFGLIGASFYAVFTTYALLLTDVDDAVLIDLHGLNLGRAGSIAGMISALLAGVDGVHHIHSAAIDKNSGCMLAYSSKVDQRADHLTASTARAE
jgi:hypothetical protein